ncbi:hypothetical protein D9K80_17300 [Acinetobacter cumulans]|uniref:Uncharacterized protein n=1 Tax=Acinetobacter cumulans TaxID=2136182 RepID=A0A498CZT8_9GAMM|nr:hypothetical protein D9K80_17300 [Acinetobacter cumulans]
MLIIGIDPDLTKSGVAILGDSLELKTMTFAETVDLFRSRQNQIRKVVIEAGWLNVKSNLHGRYGQSKSAGERIAKNVGENHATGKLLVEMAKSFKLNVIEVRPTRAKKNAEEFRRITGYAGRTNQEVRDAGMLIFGMK